MGDFLNDLARAGLTFNGRTYRIDKDNKVTATPAGETNTAAATNYATAPCDPKLPNCQPQGLVSLFAASPAFLLLGTISFGSQDPAELISLADRLQGNTPSVAEIARARALSLAFKGEDPAALVKMADSFQKVDPRQARMAYEGAAFLQALAGNAAESEKIGDKMFRSFPTIPMSERQSFIFVCEILSRFSLSNAGKPSGTTILDSIGLGPNYFFEAKNLPVVTSMRKKISNIPEPLRDTFYYEVLNAFYYQELLLTVQQDGDLKGDPNELSRFTEKIVSDGVISLDSERRLFVFERLTCEYEDKAGREYITHEEAIKLYSAAAQTASVTLTVYGNNSVAKNYLTWRLAHLLYRAQRYQEAATYLETIDGIEQRIPEAPELTASIASMIKDENPERALALYRKAAELFEASTGCVPNYVLKGKIEAMLASPPPLPPPSRGMTSSNVATRDKPAEGPKDDKPRDLKQKELPKDGRKGREENGAKGKGSLDHINGK